MRFRLATRSMTLDDLELLQCRLFFGISRDFGDLAATTAMLMKIDPHCRDGQRSIDYAIAGRSFAGVYNHNTVGENADFQPLQDTQKYHK